MQIITTRLLDREVKFWFEHRLVEYLRVPFRFCPPHTRTHKDENRHTRRCPRQIRLSIAKLLMTYKWLDPVPMDMQELQECFFDKWIFYLVWRQQHFYFGFWNASSIASPSNSFARFLNCISQMHFSTVFNKCISNLYFHTFHKCISQQQQLGFVMHLQCISFQQHFPLRTVLFCFLKCISELYFPNIFLKCISELYFSYILTNCFFSSSNIFHKV